MSRARALANRYASTQDPVKRSAIAGRMMREQWYAYVYRPDDYERLLAKRLCARPEQIPPWVYADIDDWRRIPPHLIVWPDPDAPGVGWESQLQYRLQTFFAMGGRGGGKTRCASGWWIPELLERAGMRLEALGENYGVSRDICVKGVSGIQTLIEAFDKTLVVKYDEQKNELRLANGSVVVCKSEKQSSNIEGPEYHGLWVDEPVELRKQGGDTCTYRKRAEPGVRLNDDGFPVRKFITGTPEASPLVVDIHESSLKRPHRYRFTQLSTRDNVQNLDPDVVEELYENGSEEFIHTKLDGNLVLESPHALLQEGEFARVRVDPSDLRHRSPEQIGAAMAVDSSHSEDAKSDECGIIIGGRRMMNVTIKGRDGKPKQVQRAGVHIFADASIQGGPKKWGEQIIAGLRAYPEIDTVYVEDDKSMVIEIVERILLDNNEDLGRIVRVVPVPHKNLSKKMRADPVAVQVQTQRVLHDPSPRTPDWHLKRVEIQWKTWNPKLAKKSPDRVDAYVYLVTALILRNTIPDELYPPS